MELTTFQYLLSNGWSIDRLPKELDSEQTLIIVFSSPSFRDDLKPFSELSKTFPQSKIIGCSSSGEIFDAHLFDESLSVAIVRFEHTAIDLVKAKVNDASESFQAGQSILAQLKKEDLKGIFVLSDGLGVNGSELVKGINQEAPDHLVVTGGLAGDGNQFQKTWTLLNGEMLDNHVVAVGLYGEHIKIGHASKGGWDTFGPLRRITHAKSNVLFELDDNPALKLYRDYLGDRADGLPASGLLYPLAITDLAAKEPITLVRTILAVDEKKQSLTFAGDVPEGFYAQLMRSNFDRLIDSASGAVESALSTMDDSGEDKTTLAINVSCVGRRLVLGERTEEETESTLKMLPKGSAQIGFYSYGELSPGGLKDCSLHNQTMTLTLLRE